MYQSTIPLSSGSFEVEQIIISWIRAYFTEKAGHWPNLKILCVPHDKGIQPNP
jgi:hypothetical protein